MARAILELGVVVERASGESRLGIGPAESPMNLLVMAHPLLEAGVGGRGALAGRRREHGHDLLRVRGVLSVASGTDRGTILMTDGRFRELMALPTGAHRLVLRAPLGVDLAAATAQVEGLAPGVDVQNWQELNPLLGQMLASVKVQAAVVYFILYVAVAMMEGLLQASVATVVGSVLALPVVYWLSTEGVQLAGFSGVSTMGMTMPPVWHGVYTLDAVSVPLVMRFGIVFTAVVYPAGRAASHAPATPSRRPEQPPWPGWPRRAWGWPACWTCSRSTPGSTLPGVSAARG